MQKIFPRSPYERVGGYVHLARLIDKARLHRRGQLIGYNYKTVGFDKHLLTFLQIDGDAFEAAANRLETDEEILEWIRQNGASHTPEEIDSWNLMMIGRHPDTPEKKARFLHILREAGGADRADVQTYFDLIEFEERRKGNSKP